MAPPLHALLLTFPGKGHINPMVQLASNLVSRGCFVTLVETPRSHNDVLLAAQRDVTTSADLVETETPAKPKEALHRPGIRYLTISDGLPDSFKLDMSGGRFKEMLDALEQQQGVLEKFIESSKVNDDSISCIIADSFNPWAMNLAARVGLPGVLCFSSNATSSLAFASGRSREAVGHDDLLELHNFCMSKDSILALCAFSNSPLMDKIRKDARDGIFKASQVLVNSFRELENFLNLPEILAAKTRFVGPLLPAEFLKGKDAGRQNPQEKLEYVGWLDMQVASSVLFISFGSVVHFPPAQISEIAASIEESEVKFLWVARPGEEGKTYLPGGFEERTKRNGRIIPWAEQLGVLKHPATGGFLTHCGWNSVLESISLGVPMLCFPAFADQPVNEEFIVNYWKVGLSLRDSEGAITKVSVKSAIVELMDGIAGKAVRQSAKLWKEAATQAIVEGGSSYDALTTFIDHVKSL